MRISDENLDALADEFVELKLSLRGVNLVQFIRDPERYRSSGKVDEKMKHHRFARNRLKADFKRRERA